MQGEIVSMVGPHEMIQIRVFQKVVAIPAIQVEIKSSTNCRTYSHDVHGSV